MRSPAVAEPVRVRPLAYRPQLNWSWDGLGAGEKAIAPRLIGNHMQIPRHWQSPITWRARNVTYFVVVVVSLTLFAAGLAYPERQPWISVVTLSPLVLPVALRLRFVLLVRRMKAVSADKEVMRFPFCTCDKLDEDANRSQLEARAGWAELADDLLTLWVANGCLPYRRKEMGAPLAVSVMSPNKSLYAPTGSRNNKRQIQLPDHSQVWYRCSTRGITCHSRPRGGSPKVSWCEQLRGGETIPAWWWPDGERPSAASPDD